MVPFSGCWIWTGSADVYGTVTVNKRTMGAHRASWLAFHGEIPKGIHVCHHCDTPLCINPTHLFLGTPSDNIADMDAKGRRVTAPVDGQNNPMYGRRHSQQARLKQSAAKVGVFVGRNHPKATIDEKKAREVLHCKGRMTAREAAETLGVSWHVVRNIWSGKSWGFIHG